MRSCLVVRLLSLVMARGRCVVSWGLTLMVLIVVFALSSVRASEFRLGFILSIRLLEFMWVRVVT